jgi:RNA polymerase sigma-70 factor (ECF subfamily)
VRRRIRPDESDDVVSEVFLIAWRRFDEIPDGYERAWLYGVARRAVSNTLRGDGRRSALAQRLAGSRGLNPADPYDLVAEYLEPLDQRLSSVLNALSSREREILLLVAWESLSPAELAIALSISEPAARKRLSRARQHARDLYRSREQLHASQGEGHA